MPAIEPVEQVMLPPIRPGAGWYVVGVVVIVAGLVGGFFLLTAGAFGYLGEIDDLERAAVPGEQALLLDPGEVIVFHEPEGGLLGTPTSLGLAVSDPAGRVVALDAPDEGDRYTTRDRRGVAIARFTASTEGRYEVSSSSGTGTLAIGAAPGRRLDRFGVMAVVTVLVALVVGIGVVVATRRRRRRAMAARAAMQVSGRPVERLA